MESGFWFGQECHPKIILFSDGGELKYDHVRNEDDFLK
ncbi:hypothetical protein LEP1GSC050_1571 [Leptospira broomii serovar Hurstbridge str. 5399]|uniref:Uncharacterized protein n=1 Tax=Leptospira broomii serovar Hurstbridge str. 5399 TaxID=1049789 RepID=T0F774_9LEPT|nr:hypothetical protein LEP1GSC050_1571 [Leptospira broomii serovar Hurstbridge str. 5399]